jgi:sirohydrochlorin ferrochelatase
LTPSSAYLLVFHGSRDCRTQKAVSDLASALIEQLKNKTIVTQRKYLKQELSYSTSGNAATLEKSVVPMIETASLELSPLPLHQSIIQFALQAEKQSYREVKIIPLFLSGGVHVREDIPLAITQAKKALCNKITIRLSPYLGKYSGIVQLLASKFTELNGESFPYCLRDRNILLVHGSRLWAANQHYQSLGSQLDAVVVNWAIGSNPGNLEAYIETFVGEKAQRIAILPYFLFPGKITSAIAQKVEQLQASYPQVQLILGQPLGTTPELGNLIVREVLK